MKKWLSQWTQFMQLRKEPWKKNSGLQPGLNQWPCDTGAMLYQLSNEASDVGSRSIVGSFVPMKKVSVNDIWNKSYMKCTYCNIIFKWFYKKKFKRYCLFLSLDTISKNLTLWTYPQDFSVILKTLMTWLESRL